MATPLSASNLNHDDIIRVNGGTYKIERTFETDDGYLGLECTPVGAGVAKETVIFYVVPNQQIPVLGTVEDAQ